MSSRDGDVYAILGVGLHVSRLLSGMRFAADPAGYQASTMDGVGIPRRDPLPLWPINTKPYNATPRLGRFTSRPVY